MESSISNIPVLFDSELFTRIIPFDENNPLEAGVQSDHTEIALKTSNNRVINSWNISNPAYHCYFQNGENPPFYKTHLFVEMPFVEEVMDERLAEKSDNQTTILAERFVQGHVNIQIIVEGYVSFYKDLVDKITALGSKDFQIISMLNESQGEVARNITAILIDTSKFSVLESGVVFKKYREEQDFDEQKELCLPFVHVVDKETDHSMLVVGVHVHGCGSQYPKSGLEMLVITINELQKGVLGSPDVIAAGDYNTLQCMLEKV